MRGQKNVERCQYTAQQESEIFKDILSKMQNISTGRKVSGKTPERKRVIKNKADEGKKKRKWHHKRQLEKRCNER